MRHGLFTRAVLEAIAGHIGRLRAGPVPPGKFVDYVHNCVAELSDGRQHPRAPLLRDFDADAPIFQPR